jgi:hypothetical protein
MPEWSATWRGGLASGEGLAQRLWNVEVFTKNDGLEAPSFRTDFLLVVYLSNPPQVESLFFLAAQQPALAFLAESQRLLGLAVLLPLRLPIVYPVMLS